MPWSQLGDIQSTNKDLHKTHVREGPLACPIDGTPLDEHKGVRNCPMGNYRWEGGQGIVLPIN